MKNIPLLYLVLLCYNLSGQIRIEENYNLGPSRTNGYITVVASGSAEAFRIDLYKDEDKVESTPGAFISGAYTFKELGAGNYTLKYMIVIIARLS